MPSNAEMDDAYANAAHIEGAQKYPPRWLAQAEAFRAEATCNLGVPYGEGAREQFDLFYPKGPARGVVMFVHGGYWKAFDRSYWSHLAAGPLAHGWAVAMPSYDLCPEVRIADITLQIAAAVTEVAQCIPGPIVLAGHSAGGHLVARMACADVALPVLDRVVRIVPISPVADLGPLIETAMNDILMIDEDEARRESPLHHPAPDVEVTLWVGAAERPAFVDQALRLGAAWNVPTIEDAGRHHFDVIDGLAQESSMLTMALIGGL